MRGITVIMEDLKFVVKPWKDTYGNETEAIHIDKEGQCTVSELIALLEKTKERWGDKKVLIHDINSNGIYGFDTVHLQSGYDLREEYGEDYYEDDTICIWA